jgi:predicted secreted Zn-dependent protease
MGLEDSEQGVDALTTAVVMGAIVLIMMVGAVVLVQRDAAIRTYEATVVAVATEPTPGASAPGEPAPTPTPPQRSNEPGTYTVVRGDSLFSVAAELGLSPNELIFWNADEYPTLRSTPALREGWVLRTTGPPLPTPTPVPTAAPTPTPVLAVPGVPSVTAGSFPASERVTVRWYEVTGSNPGEIFNSILANGPYSEWAGGSATAHVEVRPSFDFYFQTGPVGFCDVVATADPAISLTYEVVLPAWSPADVAAVQPGTAEWWAAELTDTVAHEAHHIALYEQHLPAMLEAVSDASCASVESELLAVWDAAVLANCEFDMAEYGAASGLTLESCLAEGE